MRRWLQTLSGRLVALATLICILAAALYLWVANVWLGTFLADLARVLAGQIKSTQVLMQQATPDKRDSLASLSSNNAYKVFRPQTQLDNRSIPAIPPAVRVFQATLQDQLGAGVQVRIAAHPQQGEPGLFAIDFEVDAQPWRVTYAVWPPTQAVLVTLLGWLLLLVAAGGAAMFLAMRWVAKPVQQLQQQLLHSGALLKPLSLPTHASSELHTLVGSFNAMVAEVEQADAKKLQMLAGLSHDLRTPLTRLRLRMETELEGQVADATAKALHADVDAMQHIIAQFMAYVQGNSRAGLGEPDSVAQIVRRVSANYPDVVCAVDAQTDVLRLRLPDVGLTRLLTNLIDNALAYGAAPVEVVLGPALASHGNKPGPNTVWQLTVYDHGTGMDDQQFVRAQEPFVRLDPSMGGVGHCGLGLAIVSQLAHQMGGRLLALHPKHPGEPFGVCFVWSAA